MMHGSLAEHKHRGQVIKQPHDALEHLAALCLPGTQVILHPLLCTVILCMGIITILLDTHKRPEQTSLLDEASGSVVIKFCVFTVHLVFWEREVATSGTAFR